MDEIGLKAKVIGRQLEPKAQGIPRRWVIILPLACGARKRGFSGQNHDFY
jgi:hypothetical protein